MRCCPVGRLVVEAQVGYNHGEKLANGFGIVEEVIGVAVRSWMLEQLVKVERHQPEMVDRDMKEMLAQQSDLLPVGCRWDARAGCHRAGTRRRAWGCAAKACRRLTVDDFQAANPDVTIEVLVVPFNELQNKFQTEVAAGGGGPGEVDIVAQERLGIGLVPRARVSGNHAHCSPPKTSMFENLHAGAACPVPISWLSSPLPQFGVPITVKLSRSATPVRLRQNVDEMPR